jgi:hypothetical protein
VEKSIKESKKPKHAPELYQVVPAENFSQGSGTQGREQKYQCPVTGKVGNKLDGIHAEIAQIRLVGQLRERDETDKENNGLEAGQHNKNERSDIRDQKSACSRRAPHISEF